MKFNSYTFAKFLFIWSSISSVFILFTIKFLFASQYVFALKDAFVFVLSVIFLKFVFNFKIKEKIILIYMFFFFLIYLYLNFFFLNHNYNAPLNNIRQIISPILLLFIFCSINLKNVEVKKALNLFSKILIFIVLFGFIELQFSLWEKIGLKQFFNLKGIPTNEFGLSYMFYEPMIGYRQRMTSTILDPISLGHFFAGCMIFTYYINKRTDIKIALFNINLNRFLFFISLISLIATFSKGAMLQAFLGILILNSNVNLLLRIILSFLPFSLLLVLPRESLVGIYIHLNGFINSIDSISLFGYGIGSAGNYSKMFSTDLSLYNHLKISDTFLGSLLGQIGIIGSGIWFLLCVLTLILLSNNNSLRNNIGLKIFISQFIVSVLSENTMNVTSLLLPSYLIFLSQHLQFSKAIRKNI